MRAPTPFVVVALALASCVEAPAPELSPRPLTFGCVSIEDAILGTWQREGVTQEYRADHAYLRDGVEGAFRFRGAGRVVLDVGGHHEEQVVGLASVNELVSADESRIGRLWSRASSSPPIPASCYDVQTSIVGTWTGGAELQTFESGGRYTSGETTGAWRMPANGHLTIHTPRTGDVSYVFAQLSDTSAVMVANGANQRAIVLTRSPAP